MRARVGDKRILVLVKAFLKVPMAVPAIGEGMK
jgi:hypothetical protein